MSRPNRSAWRRSEVVRHQVGVLFVLAFTACRGSTTPAISSAPTPVPAPWPSGVGGPGTSTSVAPAAPQPDAWFREIVDPAVLPRPVSLNIRDGAVSIFAVPDEADVGGLFVSDGRRWAERSLRDAAATRAVAWTADGSPILLLDNDHGLSVKRGPNAPRELLSTANAAVHDIATDADGVPHVCFAVGKQQEAKEFFYGTSSKAAKKGAWSVESLPMSISSCRVVASSGEVHLVVTHASGVSVLTRVGGEPWQTQRLSNEPYASAAAVITATGVAVVGYTENQTIKLLKFINGRWQQSEVVTTLSSGSLRNLALASGSDGRVHAAFRVGDGSEGGEIHYASDRSPASTVVARDRTERISLVLDAHDQPHLAYVATWPAERRLHLIHARLRSTDERAIERYAIDETRLLQSCAMVIAAEVGEAQDAAVHAGARRWCRTQAASSLPPRDQLVARCQAGEVDACLVEAARSAPLKVVTRLELAHDVCRGEKASGTCLTTFDEAGELAPWMPKQRDIGAAITLLDRACSLGSRPACTLLASNATDARAASLDVLTKACDARLPIACSALLKRGDRQVGTAPGLATVRTSLRNACMDGETVEACNALAFMEEAGLGGPRKAADAIRHHAQACERGAALSCIGLLTSRTPPRPAPNFEPDRLEELLSTRCSELGDERACLALATAYEVGWGLPRDAERARTILEEACGAGMTNACARVKRRSR